MIEPGDVTLVGFKPDPNPSPYPEPDSRIYQGRPELLGRYNEIVQVPVHGTFQTDIRMRGLRPLEIRFQEKNVYNGSWSDIKSVNLPSGYIGFRVEFPIRPGYAGQHKLQYVAKNSLGTTILHQTLKVNQRTSGG